MTVGTGLFDRYLAELPAEEKGVRLTVPTTVAPRYIPPTDQTEAARKIAALPHATSSAVPMCFELEVVAKSRISSVRSPSHQLTPKTVEDKVEGGKHVAR